MRWLALIPALSLAACMTTPASVAQCAAVTFPPNPQFGAWSVDKFTGVYTSGGESLTVRREGNALFVEQRGQAPRQITTDNLDNWRFRDGCGTEYQFFLPPDGPGARLEIHELGNRPYFSVWNRAT